MTSLAVARGAVAGAAPLAADWLPVELPGAGPLLPLLLDPEVTDVLVNADQVWADRGAGLVRVPVDVGTPTDVRRLAQRLAAAAGRRLDEGSPFVDCRLADGTRVHAVLPPIAQPGPLLSLRTLRRRAPGLGDLVHTGALTAPCAALLAAIVQARLSYLVTGGAGSGKTTLLGTLLGLVPPDERIVVVEDSLELRPGHPHAVTLQARPANVEGAGEVGLRDLIRQALRMRPDRLVVGECRGAEIVDLLGAPNTGHDGSMSTMSIALNVRMKRASRRSGCSAGYRARRCTRRSRPGCGSPYSCAGHRLGGRWTRSACCCPVPTGGW